ncbi:MAG TPA: (2Fe-2S)-binding protein [Proteobacteria bacterium]|nr:(2Fe-2S)-binding protein [Pseudomonadota bacterium]
METIELTFTLNQREVTVSVAPNRRLLDILREELHLTGTKEGCGIGECGACTVLLNGRTVNSCLILAGQAQGSEIITIEGVEKAGGKLHPLQESFLEKGAVQCGFCTPGMVLSALALLRKNSTPNVDEIREAISGNLCRCTGYKQIVEAIQAAAGKLQRK